MAPAANSNASVNVVFPLPCGPTKATQRVARALLAVSSALSDMT
jgi:hypothetical protein